MYIYISFFHGILWESGKVFFSVQGTGLSPCPSAAFLMASASLTPRASEMWDETSVGKNKTQRHGGVAVVR